jgi:hypothetical protein
MKHRASLSPRWTFLFQKQRHAFAIATQTIEKKQKENEKDVLLYLMADGRYVLIFP